MPKGVYPRSSKTGGIRTEVTESEPRPEAANVNVVEVARQTDGIDEMSTSERLFGDLEQRKMEEEKEEPPVVQNPLAEPDEPVNAPGITTPDVNTEIKKNIEPQELPNTTEEEFLDLDTFGSRKIKAKIDGREETTTFKEVLGQYQLKKHLAEAADKVGEERRKLAEERRLLQELRQQSRPMDYTENVPQGTNQNVQPNGQPVQNHFPGLDPLLQKISFLEQQMINLQPMVFQNNRIQLDQSLKQRGFNDFNDYWPKIAASTPLNLIQQFNGNEILAAEYQYFQLKAQERNQTNAPSPMVQPVPQVQPQQIPVTKIDSGSGPSSGINDDSNLLYRKAFRRASTLNDDREAWNDVLRQKGIIPDA